MNHDLLLSYLSELGSGTWQGLKDAWTWLAGDDRNPAEQAWISAKDLSALGHVEIAWGDEVGWAVTPPVVTMLSGSGGRALVTGARTRELYWPGEEGGSKGRLPEAVERLDLWLDEWAPKKSPTTAVIACESSEDAKRLADELDLAFTHSASTQIASLLPPFDVYEKLWEAGELPRGFERERFDQDTFKWARVSEEDEPGLYRTRTYQSNVYALNAPTGWFRVPRELGIFELLRWDGVSTLTYSPERRELTVPARIGLPDLQGRAATLCSGRLPTFEYGKGSTHSLLRYVNVDEHIASRIAESLSQELSHG